MNNPAPADVNVSATVVNCISRERDDHGITGCNTADRGAGRVSEGSVGDVMPMCIFVICIAFVMITFSDCVRLIGVKTAVSQISRQYILRMETYGYLTSGDRDRMVDALTEAGLKDITLGGTDTAEVGYGNEIVLEITGHTEDGYEIREFRTSTAKY